MYPRNEPLRLSMSISVFCVFLSACGGSGEVTPPELGNKTEVSNTSSTSSTSSPSTGTNKKSSVIVLDTLRAFPTAEGAGAIASGGRGGKVVYITNTNTSGPGSLRSALIEHNNEKRTIIFAVGGRFDVPDEIYRSGAGNFTLAGQTANDLGGVHLISIEGDDDKSGFIAINHSKNIQIRYISAKGAWGGDSYSTALRLDSSNDVILDHFSGGFGYYSLFFDGFNRNNDYKAGGVTLQYSLAHEGIDGHNVGTVSGGYYSHLPQDSNPLNQWRTTFGEVDVHHNAYILLSHRQTGNIYAGDSGRYTRTSNYVYGIGSRLDSVAGNLQVDYVNNVYEANRAQTIAWERLHKFEISDEGKVPWDEVTQPSIFMKGNQILNNDGSTFLSSTGNQWNMWSMYADSPSMYDDSPVAGLSTDDPLPNDYQRSRQQEPRLHPVTETPTSQVKDFVLKHAGAGVRFNDDGTTRDINSDEIDYSYILIAQSRLGPSNIGDGGIGDSDRFDYPHYSPSGRGKPQDNENPKKFLAGFDSDLDGLPDAWEKLHKVSDAKGTKVNWNIQGYSIQNNAGYTNLEMYLAERAGDFYMLEKQR